MYISVYSCKCTVFISYRDYISEILNKKRTPIKQLLDLRPVFGSSTAEKCQGALIFRRNVLF